MTITNKSIDLHILKEGYLPFQSGLERVLKFLKEKAKHAESLGLGDDVLAEEIFKVDGMIRYVENELKKDGHLIFLSGVSPESLRYLKTGGLIEIHALEDEKKKSGSRGVNQAIDKKIKMIKEYLENKIYADIEPMDFYYDIVSENDEDKQKYDIADEEFKYGGDLIDKREFRCFVILPIGKEDTIERENNMAVFSKIIEPCVRESGFNIHCYHADLIERSGDISRQVIEALRDDDIVIADLRRGNPNVIYELGIRHAFGKRSILICSEQTEHFFHTTKYRAVRYRIDGASNREFYQRLCKQIEDVIGNPTKLDNPVTDVFGYRTIDYVKKQGAQTADKLYLSRILKSIYSLGELYNLSGEDILDLNIALDFVDKSDRRVNVDARVINSSEDPLRARPFSPSIIRQKETLCISDFPRVPVKVIVSGKLASTRENYRQIFDIPETSGSV